MNLNQLTGNEHRRTRTEKHLVDSDYSNQKLGTHKTRLHIGQLVKDTSARLKQASKTDHRVEVSANKKITDAKLAKDFQAVLKEFQKAQRLVAERETTYTPFVPQAVQPSIYTDGEIDVTSDKGPEQRSLLVESRRQEVLLLDNEISFNEAIIEDGAAAGF
ncbi:syntaxin-23-like [Nicotiana sylvestris]|uniref:Syntaxin-23-like n=1 Tax=Nicotiana sylvestris TaxID=4096 RepID=A0A1U7WYI7_NICSY|nr:PREDICTED: syntaxin-23-like [Nicotiana sylvestris]